MSRVGSAPSTPTVKVVSAMGMMKVPRPDEAAPRSLRSSAFRTALAPSMSAMSAAHERPTTVTAYWPFASATAATLTPSPPKA